MLRSEVFSALRYAPPRRRLFLAREIMALPRAAFRLQPSVATKCTIKSLNDFEAACSRLAIALGRPDKTPSPQHRLFLQTVLARPHFYPGAIGRSDWFFITACVSVIAPERLLELGTLTGFSAALLASAIIAERGYHEQPVVETIDPATECIVAPEPIGFEIAQLLPHFPAAVRVHAGHDSRLVPRLFAPGELLLAFVDANHEHPFPLLDVLRLAPLMHSAGWLMLHDISLGSIGEQMRARGEPLAYGAPFGAEWLFNAWPFPKINGGNTGAIQLPDEPRALLAFALTMMRIPFESGRAKKHRRLRKMLYDALVRLLGRK